MANGALSGAITGAVVAGGGALVSFVATGGLGAGATYIANNIQGAVGKIAPAAQATSTKMQQVVAKGKGFDTPSYKWLLFQCAAIYKWYDSTELACWYKAIARSMNLALMLLGCLSEVCI